LGVVAATEVAAVAVAGLGVGMGLGLEARVNAGWAAAFDVSLAVGPVVARFGVALAAGLGVVALAAGFGAGADTAAGAGLDVAPAAGLGAVFFAVSATGAFLGSAFACEAAGLADSFWGFSPKAGAMQAIRAKANAISRTSVACCDLIVAMIRSPFELVQLLPC